MECLAVVKCGLADTTVWPWVIMHRPQDSAYQPSSTVRHTANKCGLLNIGRLTYAKWWANHAIGFTVTCSQLTTDCQKALQCTQSL